MASDHNTLRGVFSDFLWAEWSFAIWAELSSEIGTTWAELSWADFFMGRVVLGRLVFGPSCPEPILDTLAKGSYSIVLR